ncbi:GntR family transcriptional regulator [Paenibacillus sp. J2TS4]|uniref:GntR family transcriptional regulator n=1 Tax=Paenibacillus sp. J2TS4 TaxID=2807194 RepID=UPI001B2B020E|nr:GntR family transcriptional regulator [Paenibacillus sp. J2TS4]GIP31966.1 GntR family transcriptional regulator [Paenibacillus sp. J2TS4]
MKMRSIPSVSNTRNLGEQVYDKLRDSIITLELLPGQTVQENELGESLGISRTPIRDAFHLLIAEKLIDVLPQRTKKVACISATKVLESSMVRLSLESSAFKTVAKHWGDTPLYMKAEKQILRILQEQREAAELQDTRQFLQLDEDFHRQILQLAGNETLLEVVYHMRGHLNRFRFLAMKELVLTDKLVKEHDELFECLKKRDEIGIVQLLELHLGKLESEIPPLREKFPQYFQD